MMKIDFYNNSGGEDPFRTKSAELGPLELSIDEKTALVSFHASLSGDEVTIAPLPSYGLLEVPMREPW